MYMSLRELFSVSAPPVSEDFDLLFVTGAGTLRKERRSWICSCVLEVVMLSWAFVYFALSHDGLVDARVIHDFDD